jgi:hypothetical protein
MHGNAYVRTVRSEWRSRTARDAVMVEVRAVFRLDRTPGRSALGSL